MDVLTPTNHILFQIKSLTLIVYYTAPVYDNLFKQGEHGLYWSDAINMHGSGPFRTLWEALNHYDWVIQDRTKLRPALQILPVAPAEIINKVISVDFKSKKKIPVKSI